MTNSIAQSIIPIKIKDLVCKLQLNKGFDFKTAIESVYNSDLYSNLIDDNTKLWYDSSEALYLMLETEINNSAILYKQDLKLSEKVILFFIFCLENYIQYTGADKDNVLSLFFSKGVDDFIINNYEVLHTQDKNYILESIEEYLSNTK